MADIDSRKLIGIGAFAAGGYLLYEYWWKPKQFADEYNRQLALAKARNPGMLNQATTAACQVAALKFAIPPQYSQGVCAGVSGATTKLLETGGGYAWQGTKATGSAIASGAKKVWNSIF